MTKVSFKSDAETCAACESFREGAVIDGVEYPQGWHCDVNDCGGTHAGTADAYALCRVDELWDEGEKR